jgi:hypothetical protein
MNTLRVTFMAALLSASSAYADAAPHWSAAIGTGRASNGTSTATPTNATGLATSPHWSASIGTGRVTNATHFSFAKPSTAGPLAASAHWTSRIGTGRAAESNARIESSAAVSARDRS